MRDFLCRQWGKFFVFCAACIMAGLLFGAGECQAAEGDIIASGSAGTEVIWELTEKADGTYLLTISGSGDIDDNSNSAPWRSYENDITSLVIEEGVTSMGDYTWEGWDNVTEVTIAGTVSELDTQLRGCDNLTKVVIGAGGVTINEFAFLHVGNDMEVSLGSGTVIGEGAFRSSYVKTVTIEEGVTAIGASAFYDCDRLESIHIPDSVTDIGANAFRSCSSLRGSIAIPEEMTVIGNHTFYECSSLESVTIPAGVTEIGDYAFEGCSGLTSLTIPEGVSRIGNWAFRNCSGLTELRIGTAENQTVVTGTFTSFEGCDNLAKVTVFGTEGKLADEIFLDCGSITNVTIESGVSAIGTDAFSGCYAIQNGDFVMEAPCALTADTLGYSDIWLAHDNWAQILNPELYATIKELSGLKEPGAVPEFDGSHEISGYEDVTSGETDGAIWLYQAARWTNDEKTEAELRVDFSYTVPAPELNTKDYIFVVDSSGSMMDDAREMIGAVFGITRRFRDGEFGDSRVGIVPFDGTLKTTLDVEAEPDDAAFASFWYNLQPENSGSGTNFEAAFTGAYNMIANRQDTSRDPVIVFMSDGYPEDTNGKYEEYVENLQNGDGAVPATPIYTVGYNTNATENEILSLISQDNVFPASDGETLTNVYREIISYTMGQRIQGDVQSLINSTYFTVPDSVTFTLKNLDTGASVDVDTQVVTDPESGEQTLMWDLSELDYNTNYSLTVSGLQLNRDEKGRYYGGDIPVSSGDTTVTEHYGGVLNSAPSPELYRDPPDYKNLTVTKTIQGDLADPLQEFVFSVTLQDGSSPVAEKIYYTGVSTVTGVDAPADNALTPDADGSVSFTLRYGQGVALEVPNGVTYTVTETVSADQPEYTSGYTQDGEYKTGSSATGVLWDHTDIEFVNRRESVVSTGIDLDLLPFGMAGSFAAAAGAVLILHSVRKKRRGDR